MSKKTKIIIIVAVVALVVGVLIYFYNKKKKSTAASKEMAKTSSSEEPKPEPAKPNPVIIKKLEALQASGQVKTVETKAQPKAMSMA